MNRKDAIDEIYSRIVRNTCGCMYVSMYEYMYVCTNATIFAMVVNISTVH